ncbi:MAG: UDP-N-acetyl-D-glucosamine dehydrogenase [Syntrophobacter sp. DG_60]|nr:MAG: UDP-N-acetyl-D-glucosamine dehydrogenase [Syntrophobacter sp. DG_60]
MKGQLIKRIKEHKAQIGVIGLGYVGLPLAIKFAEAGFKTLGFDIDKGKVERLREGKSYLSHISTTRIKEAVIKKRFFATANFSRLTEVDAILICVPTPLDRYREPDLHFLIDTTKTVARYLKIGKLVSVESTSFPGTTEEEVLPHLRASGLKEGRDFFLVYSPEREDPGNKQYFLDNIPKVIGGITPFCLEVGKALYSSVVKEIVPVSSPRVAEMTKLLENIYRAVNIALVNEMKMLCERMGIDIWEVIEAAKTKPFGFQAFYPGPGLGGHCIPIDPFYLTWRARRFDFHTRFIELAGEINTYMPYYVVEKTVEALNEKGNRVKGAKILLLGVTYKRDIDDIRESPAFKIIELLMKRGTLVDYNDPFVPSLPKTRRYTFKMDSIPLTSKNLKKYHCLIISTDHSNYDYDFILKHANLIVDTRGVFKEKNEKVVKA